MAMALLAAGADPRNDPSAGRDEGPPLARALSQKRIELAHRLIEAGAVMEGSTGACRIGFYEAPPEPFTNSGCSWAGLLIQAGAFDLLDLQAAQGRLATIDSTGDLAGAFLTAAAAPGETVVARLLPHVGHPGLRGGGVAERRLPARPALSLGGGLGGAVAGGAAGGGGSDARGPRPARAGVAHDLALAVGRVAQLGTSSRNAVMLEVEKVNAAGGLAGRQIEMVIRDSNSQPQEAARVARELINTDGCEWRSDGVA